VLAMSFLGKSGCFAADCAKVSAPDLVGNMLRPRERDGRRSLWTRGVLGLCGLSIPPVLEGCTQRGFRASMQELFECRESRPERIGPSFGHSRKGRVDIANGAGVQEIDLMPKNAGGFLNVTDLGFRGGIPRVHENGDRRGAGAKLTQ